jgi:hypothetical protein
VGADNLQHFETEYNVSDRKLGSGACGEVFMAIGQSRRTQLACKIVDLRKLKSSPRMQIGRSERAAAAEDVDSQVQMAKIKSWAKRKQNESRLVQQLKVYYREARILASLSHVRSSYQQSSLMASSLLAAKHHRH